MPRLTDGLPVPLLILLPTLLAAQGSEAEVAAGRWWLGRGAGASDRATTYELRTRRPLTGPVSHGLVAAGLVNDSLGRRRAFYGLGYELQANRGWSQPGLRPYALAGVMLGLATDSSADELAAHWSFGGGIEWRLFSRVALGAEGRYRVDDRGPRGFWRLAAGERKGFSAAVGMTLRLGKAEGARGKRAPNRGGAIPPEPPHRITGSAADVVRTALDALGTPYQWGGTAENGFDCSGLIQYAYGQHGIRLPRVSREQAHLGSPVARGVGSLRPGDILVFSGRPGGAGTHVGMYVGERKFIHSSSTGVRLSFLDVEDPNGAYWMARWVGARRVVP